MNALLGKRRWTQEKTREWSNLIIFSSENTFLGHILENQHVQFFRAWSLLLVYIYFTPSEWPRGFVILFLI